LALALTPAAQAQFSSGSTGSDGALNLTTAGTVVFNPVTMGLDPAGDNVFNFTTINIAAGTTVVLTAGNLRNKPVIWLATGNVTIAGVLNLQGAAGATMNTANPGETRFAAMPGPGGFPGGVGAYLSSPAQAGAGYGGGAAGISGTNNGNGSGGVYSNYNNIQLVPLIGGTGGGGGAMLSGETAGGNGGAGGGAIRIVSSTSISVTGTINASGGAGGSGVGTANPSFGGSGSGGAIHLIAPTFTGNGVLTAENSGTVQPDLQGVVKISATSNQYTGSSTVTTGPLYNPPLPSGAPAVQVVSVNGVAAPAAVTGSLLAPDFTISANTPVSVNIAAQNIPLGTVVNLLLSSEQGNDSVVACTGLAGTITSSTATCTGAAFPQGITLTDIKATW
jgi:hypothetical protein